MTQLDQLASELRQIAQSARALAARCDSLIGAPEAPRAYAGKKRGRRPIPPELRENARLYLRQIRAWTAKEGISLAEFAQRIETHKQSVYDWYGHNRTPMRRLQLRIFRVTGIAPITYIPTEELRSESTDERPRRDSDVTHPNPESSTMPPNAPKRRGRPPGSKSRPKVNPEPTSPEQMPNPERAAE